jgi:hypothetical protein
MAINLSDAEAITVASAATKEIVEWFSAVKDTTWDPPRVSRQNGSQIYRFDLCPIWGKEQGGSIRYSVDYSDNWSSYAISLPARKNFEDCLYGDEKNVKIEQDSRSVRSGMSPENIKTVTVFYEVVLFGKDWSNAVPAEIVEFVRQQLVFK